MSTQRTIIDALREKRNVMHAVMLRDMRTRFFNHGIGFLIVSLWPLAHMLILIVVYEFMGRRAPYGDSLRVFFATGLVPVLAFMYISRFMAVSLVMNRPMLAFPVVRPLDIMTARALLECIAGFLTLGLMMFFLSATGSDPWPINIDQAVFAYFSVLFLAISAGYIVSVMGMLWPPSVMIYSLSMIVVYLTSGIIFVPSNLPEQIVVPLSYNPVLQCVEWLRTAYYPGYDFRLLDPTYVWKFSTICLALGLIFERLFRRTVLE